MTTDTLTMHRKPLNALTGIRFFAAVAVVFYHSKAPALLTEHGYRAAGNFLSNGNQAVLLFFLLSGFILSYTYRDRVHTNSQVRRFWEARFARIWPLYAVSLLLSTWVNHSTPRFWEALATLFMVQSWNPLNTDAARSWNFLCWTLSAEAFFYLLFPFVQRRMERWTAKFVLVETGVLSLLAAALCTNLHALAPLPQGVVAGIPLAVWRVPDFLIGMGLGNLYLLRHRKPESEAMRKINAFMQLSPLTWIALLLSCFVLCYPAGNVTGLAILSFALLLAGLATGRSLLQQLLSTRLLLLCGEISYGIYLLQWPCKTLVTMWCDRLHIGSANVRFVVDLIFLTMLSLVGFFVIEQPARKLIRAAFSRLEVRHNHIASPVLKGETAILPTPGEHF